MKNKFAQLTTEAHAGRLPDAATLFLEDIGSDILYEVHLFGWGVSWTVPMPAKSIDAYLLLGDESLLDDDNEWDLKTRTFKVPVLDALAYALAAFDVQKQPVKDYLLGRYGPLLKEARALGNERWTKTVDFSR